MNEQPSQFQEMVQEVYGDDHSQLQMDDRRRMEEDIREAWERVSEIALGLGDEQIEDDIKLLRWALNLGDRK